jgi:hypothetical protein
LFRVDSSTLGGSFADFERSGKLFIGGFRVGHIFGRRRDELFSFTATAVRRSSLRSHEWELDGGRPISEAIVTVSKEVYCDPVARTR